MLSFQSITIWMLYGFVFFFIFFISSPISQKLQTRNYMLKYNHEYVTTCCSLLFCILLDTYYFDVI